MHLKWRDLVLICCICFAWGANVVVSKWAIADAGAPPLAFAALRFLLVVVFTLPVLLPLPKNLWTVFAVSMGMGTLHFGFLFYGLQTAEAGAAGVATQLTVPFATFLSMIFLGERVGWRRWSGITLSLIGVSIIAVDPADFTLNMGLVWIAAAMMVVSMASILMKKMDPMPPMKLQGYIAGFSLLPTILLSFLFETNQASHLAFSNWGIWLGALFAALFVSLFGHGLFYSLLQRYDVSVISPLTLMTPLWAVVLAMVTLGEPVTASLFIGGSIALVGLVVIIVRPNRQLPSAAIGRKVGQ